MNKFNREKQKIQIVDLMNSEDVINIRKLIESNAHNDDLIERLIFSGEPMYVVLEKIIRWHCC